MILIIHVKLIKIAAPSPDADDQIAVILRVGLRVKKAGVIDRIELQLMSAAKDEQLYKLRDLGDGFVLRKYAVGKLDGQRTAVDNLGHIMLGK